MIPYLDLHKINEPFKKTFMREFDRFMSEGTFILGPEVSRFEEEFANYCGTKSCIGVANGLDALHLILRAYINLGSLKKGDKVLVPSNTFMATMLSVIHAGLEPILIDPDQASFNLSINEIISHFSKDVKAIIVVHLYGQLAEMDPIIEFAKTNDVILIEDAAQAHGAITKNGKKAGNLSDAAAFSFYPTKNLGALGDAGGITTNNQDLVRELIKLRNYGSAEKHTLDVLGYNSRLDPLQALFLRIKLNSLDKANERRQQIAKRYLSEISSDHIKLPKVPIFESHVFYAFVILVSERDQFVSYIREQGIGYQIHYPIPPHKQRAFSQFKNNNLPITENIHNSVISIPLNPGLNELEINKIITVLNNY